MGVDYYEYIQSEGWRQPANEAKRRAGYRCRVCNRSSSQVTLDAHHRTYDRLGHEDPDDITVLCRDCHELFETNTRVSRPARRQKQLTTVQPTWATQSYAVKQNTPSKELVLPAKSLPNSENPWKVLMIVGGGIALLVIFAWSAAVLFPLSPNTKTAISPPIKVPETKAEQTSSTVNRTSVVCGTPCSCSPVVRTITRGTQVTVIERTSCSNDTWYRIGKGEWLGPGLIDDGALDPLSRSSADVVIIPPTPTYSGPSPDDCANETNEKWAALCWDAVADRYIDDMRDYEPYDYYYDEPSYEEEPYYYDPFEDGRFVDGP